MDRTDYTLQELKASEGMMLTQAGDVPVTERVVTTLVLLGTGDSAANWREITTAEAEGIKEAKRKAIESTSDDEPGI